MKLAPLASPLEKRRAAVGGQYDLSEAASIYFLHGEEMVWFGYAEKHFVLCFDGFYEDPSVHRGLTADWRLPWSADYGDRAVDFEDVFDAVADEDDI